jgi:DNA-binding MarR family transcriptional regulator
MKTLVAMDNTEENIQSARMDLANRMFFRLYQCANMLHKTGTRAVEDEGLTTQQWAVLGALSRAHAGAGMSVGDLARYLMVSRQNLAGVVSRMERDGHVYSAPDARDRRSRLIRMTEAGLDVWQRLAQPKIHRYYDQALADFSTDDMAHALHYLLKLLGNMQSIDSVGDEATEERATATLPKDGRPQKNAP